jgi:hypothetical protein
MQPGKANEVSQACNRRDRAQALATLVAQLDGISSLCDQIRPLLRKGVLDKTAGILIVATKASNGPALRHSRPASNWRSSLPAPTSVAGRARASQAGNRREVQRWLGKVWAKTSTARGRWAMS